MFGLVPEGHPDLRPLVLHESFPEDFHPLRKSVAVNAKVRGERKFKIRTAKGQGLFQVPVALFMPVLLSQAISVSVRLARLCCSLMPSCSLPIEGLKRL